MVVILRSRATRAALAGVLAAACGPVQASTGEVLGHQKISDTAGGFAGLLSDSDFFGRSVGSLGDHDGDGTGDLAVGAIGDDDGGTGDNLRGAVWVLFLSPGGTVASHQKISATAGGFTGTLDAGDGFGRSLAALGDVDGDGIGDLAVGASEDDDGGTDRGAVWILFLNADGTVKAHGKISSTEGGFAGALDDGDRFGRSVAALRDLDGDGVRDLAVGASEDGDGGTRRGAVWILFLAADGTVASHQKISATEGGFTGLLDDDVLLGFSLAAPGDLDGDGTCDLAAGALFDDDGGAGPLADRGAVWILFLNGDGTVASHQKISATAGGFTGSLDDADQFGYSVAAVGDLDRDGVGDVAAGAFNDGDGGILKGAVWVLLLNGDGTVKAHQKISDTQGGFTGVIDIVDHFGGSVCALPDLNGDGTNDFAVGATGDDDGGPGTGAVWILFPDAAPPCPGDVNADGAVNVSDLLALLGAWSTHTCGDADIDADGEVGIADLLLLLAAWGACP